jgi:uncharacterized protein (TIGR02996 family)
VRDDEALLAAIVAHPDEDTPRLAYADWLDEHRPDKRPSPAQGPSARAELIRVQCRLAQLTPADAEYTDLLDQNGALGAWLDRHDPPAKVSEPFASSDTECESFVRGFPHGIELHLNSASPRALARLDKNLKRLTATTTVRAIDVTCNAAPTGPAFVQLPALEALSHLRVVSYYFEMPDLVPALVASPHLRHLRNLSLNSPLTDADCRALSGAKHFGALEEFVGNFGELSADGLRALAAAPWFRNLKRLALDRVEPHIFEALCALPAFPRLIALNLSDTELRADGVAALVRSKAFPHLLDLNLARNAFGAAGVEALARAKQWKLAALDLRACGLRTAGVAALAGWKGLSTVRVLDVAANAAGAKGIAALARSPHAAALRHLDLGYNHFGQSGLLALAEAAPLRNVTKLDICADLPESAWPASAAALQPFFERLEMSNLRHLMLNRHRFTVAAVRALAACPGLARLQVLHAAGCNLTDAGLKALAESPHLSELVSIELGGNSIGEGVAVLRPRTVWPKLASAQFYTHKLQPGQLKRLVGNRPGVSAG